MNDKLNKFSACILIIGNEILSGRTQEKNVSYISKWLNTIGVKLEEARIIPDIKEIIIKNVNESRKKFDYVFTTGGIGPTHDDITAESISEAFNLNYETNEEAFNLLKKYYKPGEFTEGRQRMTKMPSKAKLILNPTSGAPGFIVENVFCLPGVPSIMQSMLGGLENRISGGKKILTKTMNLKTVESEIAKDLKIVQEQSKDVEIGSYPFFRAGKLGVSIVIRSIDKLKIDNCYKKILDFVVKKKIELININRK